MGAGVGAIPSAIGGVEIKLSHVGKVFKTTPENLARWREWMRYVNADQIGVWAFFCFLGMFLNVNLATHVIPHGTDMQGLAAGAYQAKYLAKNAWSGFWFVTLFNGFWILFKTQLGNTDILVRTVTDSAWMASSKVRDWRGGRIQRVYYGILMAFSIWSVLVVGSASPMRLFTILANVAGLVLVIAGIQILIVNRKFLPAAVRPKLWRELLTRGMRPLLRLLHVLRGEKPDPIVDWDEKLSQACQ